MTDLHENQEDNAISELSIDSETLLNWEFGKLCELFQCVKKAQLSFDVNASSDVVRCLQLPGVNELCLQRHPLSHTTVSLDDASALCTTLLESFPELSALDFIELSVGNSQACEIMRSLEQHSHLAKIR